MNLKFSKIDLLTLKKFEIQKSEKTIFSQELEEGCVLCPNLKALLLFFDRVMAGRNKKTSKQTNKQASKLAKIRTLSDSHKTVQTSGKRRLKNACII